VRRCERVDDIRAAYPACRVALGRLLRGRSCPGAEKQHTHMIQNVALLAFPSG
jgi:hypothetical protein